MTLLLFLVERRDRILSRDEIFEDVWQGAAVEDGALPRSISEIRKALDDDARRPLYIRTVPKRGYQCVAPVSVCTGAGGGELSADRSPDEVPGAQAVGTQALSTQALSAQASDLQAPDRPGPAVSRRTFDGGSRLAALTIFLVLGLGSTALWLRACQDEGLSLAEVTPLQDAALPDDPEFIRLYTDGRLSLSRFEAAKARHSLEQAISRQPEEPYAHLALAETWDYLGSRKEVAAATQQASNLAASLPTRQRQWIEARALALNHQWSEAADLYRSLWNTVPDNLELGIDLARVQIAGRQLRPALETIAELRGRAAGVEADPRFDLLESEAAQYLGDWPRALEAAQRARVIARELDDKPSIARAWSMEGFSHAKLGNIEPGRQATEEAERLFRSLGDSRQLAWLIFREAEQRLNQGQIEAGEELYDEALAIFREAGDRHSAAMVVRSIGHLAADRGDLTEGEKLIRSALATYRELGDPSEEALSLNALAIALAKSSQFEQADPYFRESLSLYRQLGNTAMTAAILDNQAHMLMLRNRVRDAADRYRDVLEAARSLGLDRSVANVQLNRGLVETMAGDLPQAREAFEEAIQLFRRLDDPQNLAASLDGMGQVHIHALELAEAKTLLEEALALRKGLNEPSRLASAHCSMARLYLEEGNANKAEASARTALDISRKESQTKEMSLTYLALALLRQGRHEEAWQAMRRAQEVAGGEFKGDLSGLVKTIVSARTRAAVGERGEARRLLQEARTAAEVGGIWLIWAEAELALIEVELTDPATSISADEARERLVSFRNEAKERGFHLLVRRAGGILDLAS